MSAIEGFDSVISTLILAKTLYDHNRFEIVEKNFSGELCYDNYYVNMLETMSQIFSGHESYYNEDDCLEIMTFEDEVISNYFVNAWKYGKAHDLHYSQNPHVSLAEDVVRQWLYVSNCSSWKLCAHIRSEKSARRSKIFVYIDSSCGCSAHENIAYGLVQLYAWFAAKNTEFESMKISDDVFAQPASHKISTNVQYMEVNAT